MSEEDKMRDDYMHLRGTTQFDYSQEISWQVYKACATIKDAEIAELNSVLSEELDKAENDLKLLTEAQAQIAAHRLMIIELREALQGIADLYKNKRDGAASWLDKVRSVLHRSTAIEDANLWWPIETAPTDGTHILVGNFSECNPSFGYHEGRKMYATTVAHYFGDGFYPSWCENETDKPITVTHWRFIDYPPQQALAKSEHHNSRALEKMLLEARIEELQFADEGYDARTYARLCRLKTELAELNKE